MSDYVPNHVWENILVQLPIKNLVQCSCVCKSWYFLITSPTFISKHLNYNTQLRTNHNDFLLIRHHDTYAPMCRYAFHYDYGMFDEFMELKCPFESKTDYFTIVGCSNGLICLVDYSNYTGDLFIWNPSIRKTLVIRGTLFEFSEPGSYFHGFGFDSVKDDYVVLRIVYQLSRSRDFIVPPSVEIYRRSTGCWKSLCDRALPYYFVDNLASPPVVNRALHWIAAAPGNVVRDLIVAFDMSDEVFKEMMIPEGVGHTDVFKMSLGVLHSSLALVDYEKLFYSNYCWIWAMREYGVSESWTRLYTIDLRGGIDSLVGFGWHNEVFLSAKVPKMCSYDLETKPLTFLGTSGISSLFYASTYVESLVLFNKSDRISCPESGNDTDISVGTIRLIGEEGRIKELQLSKA